MRAIWYDRQGAADEVLVCGELPTPEAGYGEVRVKLYKGSCAVLGRRSPHTLYDSGLANTTNLDWFDSQWAQGFTSVWTLPSRLAARRQPPQPAPSGAPAP